MDTYGLIADVHAHSWSAFSSTTDDGVNSRLNGLIRELERCAIEVKKAGGGLMVIAGDLFHVRGSVAPSVLNPVMDAMRHIIKCDIGILVLAGNHDLEGKNSTRIGSALTALEDIGCIVVNSDRSYRGRHLIPWCENIEELKDRIEAVDLACREETDLIIHAPIDGVIEGLPNHGLSPEYLGGLGFKRVFAGHYHHHKEFDNGVYSIGALAHHTWSDVRSKAGFLIVSDTVKWFKSHLPEFVDIDGDMDESDATLMAEGNYVRAKVTTSKTSEVDSLRKLFMKAGAKGVVIQTIKAPTLARTGVISASVKAGASLEVSVADYARSKSYPDAERVLVECMKVLQEVGV